MTNNKHEQLEKELQLIHQETNEEEKRKKTTNFIESLIIYLINSMDYKNKNDELFFGTLLLNLNKEYVSNGAPMAVGVKDNNLTLFFSSNNWGEKEEDKFTVENLISILKHEAYHILMNHLDLYKKMFNDNTRFMEMYNIATDLEINQYLTNLPEGCVSVDFFAKFLGIEKKDVPLKAGSLVYLNMMIESGITPPPSSFGMSNGNSGNNGDNGDNKNNSNENGENNSNSIRAIDSHEEWNKSSEISKEDLCRELVNRTIQEIEYKYSKSRGSFSSDLTVLIEKINAPTVVPWQRLIKAEMGKQVYGKKKSINRLNRRLPYQLEKKGLLNDYIQPILISMDVSGSISPQNLSYFFNEVFKLSQTLKVPIELLLFDTEIKAHYLIKNKKDINLNVTGFGGTSFQSLFDFLKENKYDKESMLFIFSDGYGEREINTYGYKKHYWILTNDGELSTNPLNRPVFTLNG